MKRLFFLTICLAAALIFAALGVWQLERRIWKLDLIARVDTRIHAPPAAIPPPDQWPAVNAADHEYRRVRLTGTFRHERAILVDALTERGKGMWVLTPLITGSGTILVNRGFVPPAHRGDYHRPQGPVTVVGLMRMPEPGGRVLRPNRPAADLWYSRDVAAMAVARELGRVAPFFIDAQATPVAPYPVGGLTVVRFRNAHLVYALTWLALAGMAAFGAWRLAQHRGNSWRSS